MASSDDSSETHFAVPDDLFAVFVFQKLFGSDVQRPDEQGASGEPIPRTRRRAGRQL